MQYANKTVTRSEVVGTIWLLRYYKRFLASDFERCKDPEDHLGWGRWMGDTLTKDQARERLRFLIDCAITRKGGKADVTCSKEETDYQMKVWRDRQRLRDIKKRVRVYQFETKEVAKRFVHLLSRYDD